MLRLFVVAVVVLLLLLFWWGRGGVPTVTFQKRNTSISIFFSSSYDTVWIGGNRLSGSGARNNRLKEDTDRGTTCAV